MAYGAAVYKVRFQPKQTQQRKRQGKKPEPVDNPVMFNKSQVHPGTRFQSYGVLTYGTHWVVEKIITQQRTSIGTYRPRVVDMPDKLRDDVYIRCEETGERRAVQFHNLRYGAQWWLAGTKIS